MHRRFLPLLPLFAALVVTLLLALSASATSWSDPFDVANSAKRPDVAIDSNGEMHFVWVDAKTKTVGYRHCAGSGTCDEQETLPELDGRAMSAALAVDSENRPTVVWEQKKGKKHSIYLARRSESGWGEATLISDQPVSILPDIAIGSDDVSKVVYESVQKSGRAIYLVTFGETLTSRPQLVDLETVNAPQKVANGRNVRLAVDAENNPHIVWNLAKRPFGVKYTYMSGGAFVSPKIVGDMHNDKAPDIAIDPETNRVGIVWETRSNDRAAFILLQDGVEVLRKYNVEGGFDTVRRPRIAADCGGKFHIVFQRAKSNRSDWNVYYRQFEPTSGVLGAVIQLTNSQKDDAMPAFAAGEYGLLGFITGGGGKLSGTRAEIEGLCHGAPTPTATLSPTVPAFGWEHIPNQDPRIRYTNDWKVIDATNASDGNFARCETDGKCKKDSAAELTFTGGTRIEWETAYANTYGKVDVFVDGKIFERVDLCDLNKKSAKPKFNVRTYILRGDSLTEHTLRIQFVGDSNCSDGKKGYVAIDGFNILR